jgi:hypothetical protein
MEPLFLKASKTNPKAYRVSAIHKWNLPRNARLV